MRNYLVSLPILTLIFAMAMDSFDPWDLAIGAVLGTIVFQLFRSFVFPIGSVSAADVPHIPLWRRLINVPILVFIVFRDITVATFQVMAFVLKIRPINYQGIISLPFGERSEAATVVAAYTDTLTPGSVVAVFDDERKVLWAHVISSDDLDDVRERIEEFYENYQRKVVP